MSCDWFADNSRLAFLTEGSVCVPSAASRLVRRCAAGTCQWLDGRALRKSRPLLWRGELGHGWGDGGVMRIYTSLGPLFSKWVHGGGVCAWQSQIRGAVLDENLPEKMVRLCGSFAGHGRE